MKNQKGFSLIELMIVVAIIGILAAIAVPNFQRFQAKARQSEAKNMLSGIYTGMRAFHAEWGVYYGDFAMIGFNPNGDLVFNTGVGADSSAGVTAASINYTGAVENDEVDTSTACASGGSSAADCEPVGYGGVTPPAIPAGATTNAQDFIAFSIGNIDNDTATDEWTINQAKDLLNSTPDL